MTTAICTLFEGNYHHGLVGLVNSLVSVAFKGDVYAGYRGGLPDWAGKAKPNDQLGFEAATSMALSEHVNLHLIPLTTDYHFTNYKPDFMLELWEGPARDAESMVYLDPDIVVSTRWSDFEKWLEVGVALCEDVNSPMAQNHPVRAGWRAFYKQHGVTLTFKENTYVNGGFVGVTKSNIQFVKDWKRNQELMAKAIGGLNKSSLKGEKLDSYSVGVFAPFGKTDQDALNATVESSGISVSIAGKSAMGFVIGKTLLPHALGVPKPWDNNLVMRSLKGFRPRYIDKVYWDFARGPINAFGNSKVSRMKRRAKIASFIGRFYSRS